MYSFTQIHDDIVASVMEKGILKNAAIISNRDCSVLSSTPGFEPTTRDMIEINKAELGHLHMNVFQEKYAVRYLADNQIFADKENGGIVIFKTRLSTIIGCYTAPIGVYAAKAAVKPFADFMASMNV